MPRLIALIGTFTVFTTYSLWVCWTQGYTGFIPMLGREPWGMQIFWDLAIALSIAWAWLWPDAKDRGITPWPYLIATLFIGSIAPLAYLIHREVKQLKA